MSDQLAATPLRQARLQAGLTQRELAQHARTAQSVVARIELGLTSPSVQTLSRLLAAAGFDLEIRTRVAPVVDTHMLADVTRILAMTPEDRLREVGAIARFVAHARRV
jgi:transcriptional regulator with XRE-family HTH domain